MQKSSVFSNISDELSEKQIIKAIPLTIVSKWTNN